MASSILEFEYDVFLSFRGDDTRKGFTGHLYQALTAKGIKTFLDNEELETGRRIDVLLRIIERSEIFIPVFSKRYADSTWTLREMEKATECDRLILPVFFDVDPSDVRKQTGPFQPDFLEQEKNETLDRETVNGWREALRKAGELVGHVFESHTDGVEAKFIQIVVKDVLRWLKRAPLDVATHPIGVDPRVEDVMKLLDMEADDVRIVGIHGMGGIGKTTISKAIFNIIHRKFDGASFIFNIAKRSKQPNGLVGLQKKLIADLFNVDISSINIDDPEEGTSMIRRRVAYKKILLVLDDVDHRSQLESLAGNTNWFHEGSRVLITSRDDRLLSARDKMSHKIYRVEELDQRESLQLFSYHAFGSVQPPAEYLKISQEAARTAGGLPLALEVHGSLFFDLEKMEEWEEMLGKLRSAPDDDVRQKLKVSYDGLADEEKRIFLDIAHFFVGKGKDNAMQMWESPKTTPNLSIKVLVHKSLLKINSENGVFEMHDVIRDLGRYIVRQESPWDPWLRSRLWDADDILHVLQNPQEEQELGWSYILNSDQQEEEELGWSYILNSDQQEEEELGWPYIPNSDQQEEEEELGLPYIPNSDQLSKLIIKVPFDHWMGKSVRSIGVLIYATVGREAIYESTRMAHEDTERVNRYFDVGSRFFVVRINNDDEICKYIGDEDATLHVRLGMQDLKSRHSGRITFERLRQLHISGRWFPDSGGEEEKRFFSCMIPKSRTNSCEVYIKELVLRGKPLKNIKDPIEVHLKVEVEDIPVFETTRVSDGLEDSKENEDSGRKFKFGVDDAIHKVLGRAPAVLHVNTSSLHRTVDRGRRRNTSSSTNRMLNQAPLAARSTKYRCFDVWADVSIYFG